MNEYQKQGVHYILCFFRKFQNIFRTLASLGFPALCTPLKGRQNTSAAAELAKFRKNPKF